MKLFNKFKIGPFWSDWQTPPFVETACIEEPQIHELAIFFSQNGPTLTMNFVQEIV